MTLSGLFFDHASRQPDKPALIFEGEVLSYAALSRQVRRCAAGLVAHGLHRGEHLGVVLPNGIGFVVLLLAAADLGLVLVPLPPGLPIVDLRRGLAATDTRHLVAGADLLDALDVPGLRLDEAALVPAMPEAPPPFGWGREADGFILTMTSGSTGQPKPILLLQGTKLARARAVAEMYGVTAEDVTLAATPLYHSLAERLVILPLVTGGTAVLMARFSARDWLEEVRRHGVTFTIAVSTQLGLVAEALASTPAPDSLRCVVSSSALLKTEVKALLRRRLGCALHECYGASEIACATTLDMQAGDAPLGSVGRAAPGVELLILAEDGTPAPAGTQGEILCRTPQLFAGYYRQPELTAAALHDGYFRTGDLGRLDADGYLFFLGRTKELIITGGINVIPADVELALVDYPDVVEAAAFAVPDARLGEVVGLAFVSARPEEFDLRRLRRHFGRRLADYQQPQKFLALPALPRNAMGKPTRHVLLDLYLAAERQSA